MDRYDIAIGAALLGSFVLVTCALVIGYVVTAGQIP